MSRNGRATVLAVVLGTALGASAQWGPPLDAQRLPGRIAAIELKPLHEAGKVVVVDVRSAEAYAAEHVTGALSVPLETVASQAAELSQGGKPVVTYCT